MLFRSRFLLQFLNVFMYAYILVLLIIGIKEVNNYTAKETLKVIALSLFTVLIMALIIFIIYVLWSQVFEFIAALIGEVVYRIGS